MATLNNIDSVISTLKKRGFNIFSLENAQMFFAQKKTKMCGYEVILSVGILNSIINISLECGTCIETQIIKINKQMSIPDILSMKVPFWYIYESSLNDIRNSFHELLIENNVI